MSSATHNPLTRVVKRILDVLRILAIVSLILWPLFVLGATMGQYSDPESWGVDILAGVLNEAASMHKFQELTI